MKSLKHLILVFGLFSTSVLFAQSNEVLQINEDGSVAIPSQNLSETYRIDIADLELASMEVALEFFRDLNQDLVVFRPNMNEGQANMHLQIKKRPNWTTEDWNNYLSENIDFDNE